MPASVDSRGDVLRLHVDNRGEMDETINHAVGLLVDIALRYGDRGIRVVRHSANDFTVKLDRTVPYGACYEQQDW